MNAELALVLLVQAIHDKRERRVLLSKRPGERRTESVVLLREITSELSQAEQVLHELRNA